MFVAEKDHKGVEKVNRVTKYGAILMLGVFLLGIWLSFHPAIVSKGKSTLFSICLLLIAFALYLIVNGKKLNDRDEV